MDYGLIGNCAFSALVKNGSIDWLCFPRMDSSFVFGRLLDAERGGHFTVDAPDIQSIQQAYINNTNVIRTVFHTSRGSFSVTDFAPRFRQYARYYKPTMVIRILRAISGEPLVRVVCDPVGDYGRQKLTRWSASNHLAWQGLDAPLRLTTNAPLTAVEDGRPFLLDSDIHMVLTYGQPLETDLVETAEASLRRTIAYWHRWVKHTNVPRDYQEPVIRSALALKLHQFEDTGALLAATTTSLPEYPGSGRNWDYRFCWLRDSYFTLNALERLGHFEEMELFIDYLRNLCENFGDELRPVYTAAGGAEMEERILGHLSGFRGDGPVRIGNQAHEHVQNDVYGEMILAISRVLIDARFIDSSATAGTHRLVHRLLSQIEQRLDEPDAGLWELRGTQQLHSFTLLMHWAGARRAQEIGQTLGDTSLEARGARIAEASRDLILSKCWNPDPGVITQAAGKTNLDAALLLAVHLGFFEKDDPAGRTHVHAIAKGLAVESGYLKRYDVPDDFGLQEAAFTVCSFWLAEALARVGRKDEARAIFNRLLSCANQFGLLSEDILPTTHALSGNFPQTYSHVGLINTAFRLSRDWG
jgi:GH15 family glucan-1,4-alpha-glucosidase